MNSFYLATAGSISRRDIVQLEPFKPLERKNMPPRPRYEMPDFFLDTLEKRGLMDACLARPAYQRNDYIGLLRVTRANLEATRQKRLNQMLDELERGGVYMKVEWKG